jgi:hypothetical protein
MYTAAPPIAACWTLHGIYWSILRTDKNIVRTAKTVLRMSKIEGNPLSPPFYSPLMGSFRFCMRCSHRTSAPDA